MVMWWTAFWPLSQLTERKKNKKEKKRTLSSGRNNNDSISVPRLVITQSPVFTLNFDDKLLSNHDNIRSFTGQNKLPVIACMIKGKSCFVVLLSFPLGNIWNPTIKLLLSIYISFLSLSFLPHSVLFLFLPVVTPLFFFNFKSLQRQLSQHFKNILTFH